jgi:hypothetical protein
MHLQFINSVHFITPFSAFLVIFRNMGLGIPTPSLKFNNETTKRAGANRDNHYGGN